MMKQSRVHSGQNTAQRMKDGEIKEWGWDSVSKTC